MRRFEGAAPSAGYGGSSASAAGGDLAIDLGEARMDASAALQFLAFEDDDATGSDAESAPASTHGVDGETDAASLSTAHHAAASEAADSDDAASEAPASTRDRLIAHLQRRRRRIDSASIRALRARFPALPISVYVADGLVDGFGIIAVAHAGDVYVSSETLVADASPSGQRTLAHEFAHACHQRLGVVPRDYVGTTNDEYEQSADRIAELAIAGGSVVDQFPEARATAGDDAGKAGGTVQAWEWWERTKRTAKKVGSVIYDATVGVASIVAGLLVGAVQGFVGSLVDMVKGSIDILKFLLRAAWDLPANIAKAIKYLARNGLGGTMSNVGGAMKRGLTAMGNFFTKDAAKKAGVVTSSIGRQIGAWFKHSSYYQIGETIGYGIGYLASIVISMILTGGGATPMIVAQLAASGSRIGQILALLGRFVKFTDIFQWFAKLAGRVPAGMSRRIGAAMNGIGKLVPKPVARAAARAGKAIDRADAAMASKLTHIKDARVAQQASAKAKLAKAKAPDLERATEQPVDASSDITTDAQHDLEAVPKDAATETTASSTDELAPGGVADDLTNTHHADADVSTGKHLDDGAVKSTDASSNPAALHATPSRAAAWASAAHRPSYRLDDEFLATPLKDGEPGEDFRIIDIELDDEFWVVRFLPGSGCVRQGGNVWHLHDPAHYARSSKESEAAQRESNLAGYQKVYDKEAELRSNADENLTAKYEARVEAGTSPYAKVEGEIANAFRDKRVVMHNAVLSELTIGSQFVVYKQNTDDVLHVIKRALPKHEHGFVEALKYAKEQGWGAMDFAGSLGFFDAQAAVAEVDGVLYDANDYGNFLWGAAMQCLSINVAVARTGAHYNNLSKHHGFDTESDQLAIHRGAAWALRVGLAALVFENGENVLPSLTVTTVWNSSDPQRAVSLILSPLEATELDWSAHFERQIELREPTPEYPAVDFSDLKPGAAKSLCIVECSSEALYEAQEMDGKVFLPFRVIALSLDEFHATLTVTI